MSPVPLVTPTRPPPEVSRAEALLAFVREILPYRRSITGEGLRQTLGAIAERIPLQVTEVFSGTPLLDWTAPPEWVVHEAHLTLPDGQRIADWDAHPLHLVQYSGPREARMSLADLRPHLHTLPDHPDWIPYRTAYWTDDWGFCLRHCTLESVAETFGEEAEVEVLIDTRVTDGSMSVGECVIPGATDREILISAHACHPALANDNASALAVATFAAHTLLRSDERRHTIRFLFAPGTIGALAWLAAHPEARERVVGGLVLANLGDAEPFVYKRSRRGTLHTPTVADRAVETLFPGIEVRPFEPFGYDERQFNSPGFDLPVGRLTRTPHGEYPEYHTSADDLSLLTPDALEDALEAVLSVVSAMDGNARYVSTQPFGEPMLGRRGLYAPIGGKALAPEAQRALLWVLNLSDGDHDLLHIASRSDLPFAAVRAAADRLLHAELIRPAPSDDDA
ncbi:MAG: DUF4910 domain-containing protein [Bacteroidota bacterium]